MEAPAQIVQKLFSLGDATLFVWKNEPGWPVSYVSENVQRLLGVPAERFTSGDLPYADLVHPDDIGPLGDAVAETLRLGAPTCLHDDYRVQHADGRWIWVHDVAVIERDEAGEVTAFVGYVRDVTAEHVSAAELAAQRDRLELVLGGTRLGLWDWNPQTNDVVFDERWAQMLGYELAEVEFTLESWSSRVHPDDLEPCFDAIKAHMAGETEFYENVHRMRHKDGRWVYILDRGRICERDADGNPTRFTGTHTDITAQCEAEQAAVEASRAKTDFLARMSHEIRTPLNGVLGVLQLLEGTELDEQQQRYLDVVRESGETLLTIINDVLDVSKIEAGELEVEERPFHVHRMLRSLHDLYRERAQTKKLEYPLEIHADVPDCVVGDSHRIRQVLSNLLSNAFKFTESGEVSLGVGLCSESDGSVELEFVVADSGVGIADVAAVWEPFRQADVSTSRKFGGTGLGLTVCRQLTEVMGGTIDVDTRVGHGTEFRVRLPFATSDAPLGATDPTTESESRLPILDVLVAEDNAVNQMVISAVLGRLGQHVTVVENGVDALAECRERDFDLVLMDIHMPEMDGIEACRKIRESVEDGRQPRIVALSADAFAPNDEQFRGARFDGAVSKPFKVADISRVIRSV